MRGRAGIHVLGGLSILLCLLLLLQFTGIVEFVSLGRGADRGGQDELALLEEELFEELRRGPTLRGLPGIEIPDAGVGVLTGKVMLHVAGSGPQPLQDVRVQLLGHARRRSDGEPRSTRAEAETEADGTFTFPETGAHVGYVLIVDHAPYRRIVLRGLSVARDRTTNVGTLLLGAPTTLTGVVVDARGRPIRGARVHVLRDVSRPESFDARRAVFELQSAGNFVAEAVAGADGQFLLKDLPPGRYILRVGSRGYATTFKDGVLVTVDEQSSSVRVVLDPGAGLYGRVLDETGRGLAGGRVIAVAIPGKRLNRFDHVETRTASDGSYRLDTLISGMTYGIEAWAEGYAPTGTLFQTVSGLRKRDWQLLRSGSVEGRVTDERTGEPVPDAQVTVLAGSIVAVSPVSTVTDATGHFLLPHVNPGPILVFSCAAVGYQPSDKADARSVKGFRVEPGETTWIDWTLRAGGTVYGRVTSDGGKAVPYASLALADRKKRRQRWTGEITGMTDADGRYELAGVRPGIYDLHVHAAGYAPVADKASTRVTMTKALADVLKDVRLARGGVVHGTVQSPEGAVVGGARVWIEPADASTPRDSLRDLTTVSGAAGSYRVQGIPPGVAVFVAADHDAYVRGESKVQRLSAGQSREVLVTLRRGAVLPGRVEDVRGAAVEGARIRWGSVDGIRERDLRDSFSADEYLGSRVLRTDVDGRFEIERLPPGRLLLKVEADGFAAWYRRDLAIGEEGRQPAVTVTLEATLTIRGHVRAAETGRPLAGAFVYARERGSGEGQPEDPGRVQAVVSAESAADGSYVLDRVPPGIHEVVVWFAEGYVAAAQNWRHPKTRRKGVLAGSSSVDFELDPIDASREGNAR